MKTKHLLTALALPAVFAACTAEDIVTESASQTQRVALNENFKMNFGGVESRLSAGEPGDAFEFTFEKGDMVGGAIIDQFTPDADWSTQEEYEAQYNVIDYVSANQPFTFDGSEWTINHTMVEGKYLFYYPYNEANNSRGAAQFSIPVMQDLSDKETGEFNPKAAIEKYSMAVGYQFLSKDDLSASVELAPIFSYARIVLKLDNRYPGGDVEKIVLQAGKYDHDEDEDTDEVQDYFNLSGQLGNVAIKDIFVAKETDKTFKWESYDKTAQFALTTGNYYNAKLLNPSVLMVGKVPAGTSMKVDAQGNKSFETYMVMPAQEMKAPITVYLYTTDGNIYSGNTVATFNGDFNRNTPKKMEVSLVEAQEIPFVIASQEDWNTSVAQMGKKPATFIIADPEFTLTNDAKFPTNEDAIITVDNVIVSGDNVKMTNVKAGTVTVAEGAKLTTDVTTTIDKIINKGEVVVAANPEVESRLADENEDGLYDYDIDAIENHATLTINKDAVIAVALNNKKGAVVENAGILYVAGTNNGTINNAGEIYVSTNADTTADADFVNCAREHKLNAKSEFEVTNVPTINNKATGKFRADADFINYSVFVNEGILSCKNNAGTITNSTNTLNEVVYIGVIDAKTNSTNYISANNGKVIVYDMLQANVTTNGGVVEYTATGASVVTDASIVTDIIATKDLEIKYNDAATSNAKACNLQDVTIKGNATIKMTWVTGKTPVTLKVLTVESGNVTLASNIKTESLIVKKGAVINVPKDLTLTVTTATYNNGGTISVAGTMSAVLVDRVNSGNVEDNGLGTLQWLPTDLDLAKKAYVTALANAIKVWVSDAGYDDGNEKGVNVIGYDLLKGTSYADAIAVFNKYYAELLKVGNTAGTDLKKKLEAYDDEEKKEYENKATAESDAYVNKTVTAEWAAGVKEYRDAVIASTTTFAADVTKAAVLNEYLTDMADNSVANTPKSYFFDNDSDTSTDVKSEKNALKAFKALVLTNSQLTNRHYKAALCTAAAWSGVSSYIPAYSFAFESSNIYKLINEYYVEYGFNSTSRDFAGFKNWIEAMSGLTDEEATTKQKIVRDWLNANNYAVYKEYLKWNYTAYDYTVMLQHAANN